MAQMMDIKCSNCGSNVPIADMGDHVCKSTPASPSPPPPPPKSDSDFESQSSRPSTSGSKSGRRSGPPPRIDPSIANRPFLRPSGSISQIDKDSLTPSPLSMHPGQRLMQRSQTSPLPNAPYTSEVINQDDGHLPSFPLPRSMSRNRLGPSPQLQMASSAPPLPSPGYMDVDRPLTGARSPRGIEGEPSPHPPFAQEDHNSSPVTGYGHQHGSSIDSRSSYGTSIASTRYGANSSKRSTAISSRRPSFNSVSQLHQFPDVLPPIPSTPLESFTGGSPLFEDSPIFGSAPPRERTNSYAGFDFGVSTEQTGPKAEETEKMNPDPLRVSSHTNSDRLSSSRGSAELFFQSPSQSSYGRPSDLPDFSDLTSSPPASSTNMEYKAFKAYAPSPSEHLQPTGQDLAPKDAERKNSDASDSGLSVSNFARALGLDFPDQAIDNSTASSSSSPSETRSGTSLSSLLSEASLSRRKPSETSRLGPVAENLQTKGNQHNIHSETDQTESPTTLELPRIPDHLLSPDSPTDPAIGAGSLSLIAERMAKKTSHMPLEIQPIKRSATEPPARPPPRPKGRCRGCGEAILGKSVSSKDGRLTGRYHRECFVCCHCRGPFETADFYVLNDRPYCAQHYHELNGSLCRTCNKGIEGQYLETNEQTGPGPADRQKFHPECLTCRTCHVALKGEYFEWNGSVYCERDARRAAASVPPPRFRRPTLPSSPLAAHSPSYPPMPSPGQMRGPGPGPGFRRGPGPFNGPPPLLSPMGGRRFPERRTTRLMMT